MSHEKSDHLTKSQRRPVLGLALLACAAVLVFPEHCGELGKEVSSLFYLVGGLGRLLAVMVFLVSGVIHAVPREVFARARKTAETVVKSVPRRKVREPANDAAVDSLDDPEVRLAEIKGAMKDLGYLKSEYGPVVAAMDLNQPLEVLVREGITKLRGRGRAS